MKIRSIHVFALSGPARQSAASRRGSLTRSLHRHACLSFAAPALLAVALTACGGGGDSGSTTRADNPTPVEPTTVDESATIAQLPTFHLLPETLAEPADTDSDGLNASADALPTEEFVPANVAELDTARLTVTQLEEIVKTLPETRALPTVATVFTPAQIRAAYALPPLPTSMAGLSGEAEASLGAGQTIYIVDAFHNPSAAADLAAFNAKFGLPGCRTVALSKPLKLPLGPAGTECTLSIVSPTAVVPIYDETWAIEAAMDVQWAHAIAPLARIVLIETVDNMTPALMSGVALANTMGPGAVSMSFASPEGAWGGQFEATFSSPGMTYFAGTGDWGAQVNWPSVSSRVVAVGGTTLSYSGSGARIETAWEKTGGGTSRFFGAGGYQWTAALPGQSGVVGAKRMRGMADVSMNSDPFTGQYIALTHKGDSAPSWHAAGGTSIATPEWAAIVAIANAMRARIGKPTASIVQSVLYNKVAAIPGLYLGAFDDIKTGSNGSCATCTAGIGYDLLTGLGTPNVSVLLPQLVANDQ